MRIIVISAPDFLRGEAAALTALLEAGAWRVHVRKPAAGSDSIARLLEHIPAALYSRISLHDHHELAAQFGVGGVHLNGRNPSVPDGFGGLVSRSCHSISELSQYGPVCDYMFLSPIFDSISKSGYVSRFSLEEIRRRIAADVGAAGVGVDAGISGTAGPMAGMSSDGELSGRDHGNVDCRSVDWGRVFALGGVCPDNIRLLEETGFGGAAVLGYLWEPFRLDHNCAALSERLRNLMNPAY